MRRFKLLNSKNEVLDITTNEYFFHDISGLGFVEDNVFRSIGRMWSLVSSNLSRKVISGKICFTENGNTTPYQKYSVFASFIVYTPLTLQYTPDDAERLTYSKLVRVSKLEKTEINKYGVIDEKIEFTPYTPWYMIKTINSMHPEADDGIGWIWDVGNIWDNQAEGLPKYKFGAEPSSVVSIECEEEGLVKLTIMGPAVNPSWTHHVDGQVVSSGGMDPSVNLTLGERESLIIDNTNGSYSMIVASAGRIRNVYALRNFDLDCFFTLRKGKNAISALSSDSTALSIIVEAHELHATV